MRSVMICLTAVLFTFQSALAGNVDVYIPDVNVSPGETSLRFADHCTAARRRRLQLRRICYEGEHHREQWLHLFRARGTT